jgi:hypothetical protein
MVLSISEIIAIIGIIAAIFVTVYAELVYVILSRKIKKVARLEVEKEKNRMGANMLVDMGFTYWGNYQISGNSKYLNDAIRITEAAYSNYGIHLDESDLKNELLVCQIKNNLAWYYAERGKEDDGAKARQYADDILDKSPKFETLRREEMIDTYKYVQKKFPEAEVAIHLGKKAIHK